MTTELGYQPTPPWLSAGPALALWQEAAKLAALVAPVGLTVATAESLTGGWLSAALTSVPGSSAYFLAGFTAYSNGAKMDLLGVPPDVIASHGAVSPQCAEAMALGAQKAAGADLGVATTGIAGPDGGSDQKPVGLVYVAAAVGRSVSHRRHTFSGDRLEITLASAVSALALLSEALVASGLGGPILV
ncbi:MAG: CinA family protein [Deltaproteobacteria bacterium]|jgi:PncC family amidohydrolase|nr:CinA family protein [Deltaproteobacteria bacterium]